MKVKNMYSDTFIQVAKDRIIHTLEEQHIPYKLDEQGVALVWFSKTIMNKKALFMIPGSQMYFEVTANGETDEIYVDIYKKEIHKTFKEE